MKVLIFNVIFGKGSTGVGIQHIYEVTKAKGYKCKVVAHRCYTNENNKNDVYQIGNAFTRKIHTFLTLLTDKNSYFSYFSTLKAINYIKKYDPDVIHLNNLHGGYVCLPLLFKYLSKSNKQVIMTLRDCWNMTGHCVHFIYANCDKWKTGCYKCPVSNIYPKSLVDNSKDNYLNKKKWFTSVKNMTITAPSTWMIDRAKESFLNKYPMEVIFNGIDLEIFKPRQSNFREKLNIGDKKLVLSLTNLFSTSSMRYKDIIKLSEILPKEYQLVLVGIDEDKLDLVPKNIIALPRTANPVELAEIYSAADVFVNTSHGDSFGLVNIEALACGTPIVMYDAGGNTDIPSEKTGIIVKENTPEEILKNIPIALKFNRDDCVERAKVFDYNKTFLSYLDLYERLYKQ